MLENEPGNKLMIMSYTVIWMALWPNGYWAGLQIERSGFKPWPGHYVVFLGKTPYFKVPRCGNGCRDLRAGRNPVMD